MAENLRNATYRFENFEESFEKKFALPWLRAEVSCEDMGMPNCCGRGRGLV